MKAKINLEYTNDDEINVLDMIGKDDDNISWVWKTHRCTES